LAIVLSAVTSADNEDAGNASEQPDPRTRLMQEVAQEMDDIEEQFGENFEMGRVITIVEVITPPENVGLRVRAGQYPWVTLGMLHAAVKILEAQMAGGSER
jgi:hypothetical protein